MSSDYLRCPCCKRTDFKTQRGLNQHLRQSVYCANSAKAAFGDETGYHTAHEHLPMLDLLATHKRKYSEVAAYVDQLTSEDQLARKQIAAQNASVALQLGNYARFQI